MKKEPGGQWGTRAEENQGDGPSGTEVPLGPSPWFSVPLVFPLAMCLKNIFNSVKFYYRIHAKQQIAPQTQQIDIGLTRYEHIIFDDLPFAPIEHL